MSFWMKCRWPSQGSKTRSPAIQWRVSRENWLLQRGIERGLEIISEAVRHVPDHLLAQESSIAWQDIRSIGNLIRHEYHRVEPAIVWSVVVDDLTPLRDA